MRTHSQGQTTANEAIQGCYRRHTYKPTSSSHCQKTWKNSFTPILFVARNSTRDICPKFSERNDGGHITAAAAITTLTTFTLITFTLTTFTLTTFTLTTAAATTDVKSFPKRKLESPVSRLFLLGPSCQISSL